MPASIIPAFLYYCFINGITPGPANLCSLAASMNYGRRRALIQWTGLFTGFVVMALLAVLLNYFLGAALGDKVAVLRYIGAAYIVWLAIKLVRHTNQTTKNEAKECNFFTGLIVNLTNIKVLLFCITALSTYVLPYTRSFGQLLAIGCFLPFTGPLCNLVWLFAGSALRGLFEKHPLAVNLVMAASLIVCAVRIVIG
ncbi:MAG: LysE family transporter [Firmicutes bacterium]|nr:LysE family transporter [Bacillota bacterium]